VASAYVMEPKSLTYVPKTRITVVVVLAVVAVVVRNVARSSNQTQMLLHQHSHLVITLDYLLQTVIH
jgi:hypothetical protein